MSTVASLPRAPCYKSSSVAVGSDFLHPFPFARIISVPPFAAGSFMQSAAFWRTKPLKLSELSCLRSEIRSSVPRLRTYRSFNIKKTSSLLEKPCKQGTNRSTVVEISGRWNSQVRSMTSAGSDASTRLVGPGTSGKSEREKMLAGELYSPLQNPELKTLHRQAVRLVNEFNATDFDEEKKREELTKEIFGSIGKNPYIEPRFFCDYGKNTFIGDDFYANAGLVILDANTVHIGHNVLCAPNVQIYAATHPTDPAIRAAGLELALPVRIGNNVWIGGGAIINPGVTVGDNSVIGSGSVVTRDVPSDVVVAGNPARVLRQLVGTA